MKKANLHEAKTQLSKLVEQAHQGEEMVTCKAGTPVAKLTPIHKATQPRTPGGWEEKLKIEKDFDHLPEDFMEFF